MKSKQLAFCTIPDSNRIWKAIGGNYERAEQIINELIDNSLSNIYGHKTEIRKIELTLEETNDIDQSIIIKIEDSGMGIENPQQAFTLGDVGNDSVWNEHGFGLKQAMAAANPDNDNWEVWKRSPVEREAKKAMCIKAPYQIGEQPYKLYRESSWPGHPWGNTYIKIRCEYRLFLNMIDVEEAVKNMLKIDFDAIADRIYEDIGFYYATILERKDVEIKMTLRHANGTRLSYTVTPILPLWLDSFELRNDAYHVICKAGHIDKLPNRVAFNNNSSNFYYKQDMSSSGVELRINGRIMEHNQFEAVFGKKNNSAYNSLLVQVDIISDNRNDLPKTRTIKNGFRIGDERLSKIYAWIRDSIQPNQPKLSKPITVTETEEKKKLAEIFEKQFYESKDLELNNYEPVANREVPVFKNLLKADYPRVDILLNEGEKISVIEAKKNSASLLDVYQLRMYCDGYFLDNGKMPDAAILVAKEFSDAIRRLIEYLNNQPNSVYPQIHWKHWNEFEENFEETLIEEKKLKLKFA